MTVEELATRIVDQVERGLRREEVRDLAEARRRFDNACPWSVHRPDGRRGADPHWSAYMRLVERALTRLYSPAAGPVEVTTEEAAPLAVLPELEEWARRRRVEVRAPAPGKPRAEAEAGPEELDLFAGGEA